MQKSKIMPIPDPLADYPKIKCKFIYKPMVHEFALPPHPPQPKFKQKSEFCEPSDEDVQNQINDGECIISLNL